MVRSLILNSYKRKLLAESRTPKMPLKYTQPQFTINDILDHNTLTLILDYFQENEESFIVRLVCKKWNSLIKPDKDTFLEGVLQYYARYGHLNVLKWFE